MKIVVALDSFKGTLTASDACAIVHQALAAELPEAEITDLPMADGGEGTAEALVAASRGVRIEVPDVTGPLPEMRCTGHYGWLERQQTAVIEMAEVSGLPLLKPSQRNPLKTTTFGTGELMWHAAHTQGARRILLALGGSATVDGGTGAARTWGWQFLDKSGQPVPDGGGGLRRIARIIPPREGFAEIDLEVLCDVTNPLCGPTGAAAVYAPQKGATPEMVQQLDNGLQHLAHCVSDQLALNIRNIPGAGAAGGFGAGALAFFGGRLVPGIDAIADTCGLDQVLEGADWVITGEGRLDNQSLQGKVIDGVRKRAQSRNIKVAVLAGRVDLPESTCMESGLDRVIQTAPPGMQDEEAMADGAEHLKHAALEFARSLSRPDITGRSA